jgi:hypothetical protein
VVRFVIGANGDVLGAIVTESTLSVPSVGQCVASAMRRWHFPAHAGGAGTVNYPGVFAAGDGSPAPVPQPVRPAQPAPPRALPERRAGATR